MSRPQRDPGIALGRREWLKAASVGAAALGAPLACRRSRSGARRLRVWAHRGQEAEHRSLRAIAQAFGREHPAADVELSFFPDFQYTEKLSIAAAAGDMPDAFEIDGPLVARFVDAGLVAPLDGVWSEAELRDFLPTILRQGTIAGRPYALGAFDSAVVLYYDRASFSRARIVPADAKGFSWGELLGACSALAALGVRPLALHMNESADEWFTYAFSPVIWSGGGALIAADGERARGVLASAENVASLRAWQTLFQRRFARTDPRDPDPFGSGEVAMDWTGHWMARSHLTNKGEQLGAMPLPRLGTSSVAPCGSFCWAVSSKSAAPELAQRWLRWVTDTDRGVLPLVRANGAVPARRSAFEQLPEYAHLPFSLFQRQLQEFARPRPRTPFYATLTQRFAAALRDIARGADVAARLARAERELTAVIERRRGPGRGQEFEKGAPG